MSLSLLKNIETHCGQVCIATTCKLITILCVCAVEEMAAAHAGAAKSPSAGGAASPPGGAAEAAGNDEWIPALHSR